MEERYKILIIDDDPDYVEGVQSTLESANYEVDAAYNPKEGFESLQSKQYDLLVLDIMMGRGSEGIMVARKISKDPKLREIPVLIVTGIKEQIAFLFPGQAVRPQFVPINELIEKPVEPDLLLDTIAKLLKQSEERKAEQQTEQG